MTGKALNVIAQFLEANDISVESLDDGTLLTAFEFEGGSISIGINFLEAETHVHIEGFDFLSVPKDKYGVVYEILNDCNAEYPHVKFYLDKEQGTVIVEDDDIVQLDSCGQECFELIIGMVTLVSSVAFLPSGLHLSDTSLSVLPDI